MKKIIIGFLLVMGLARAESSNTSSFKFIPTYGVLILQSDFEDFKSKLNYGISLEKMISDHFSFGLLFNYSNFNFNHYYYPSIESKLYSLGPNLKFFLLKQGSFRPFIGGELAFNLNKLSLKNYGSYSLSDDSFSGFLTAGTEIYLGRDFGINLDFRYGRTLSRNDYPYYLDLLETVSDGMKRADLMSFNFGLLIRI